MLVYDYMNVSRCCDVASICFFFKQKTAYEMRIRDWSSDVCSSDLLLLDIVHEAGRRGRRGDVAEIFHGLDELGVGQRLGHGLVQHADGLIGRAGRSQQPIPDLHFVAFQAGFLHGGRIRRQRPALRAGDTTEEHKSELQSLKRRSYAVLYSKKK